ncbi:MAG: hypothetical protein ACKPKO_07240, partial [Candidatus Fonsibacter sp.]
PYHSVVHNVDVKFKSGLCNCAPSKIEGYVKYAWAKRVVREAQEHPEAPRRALRCDQGRPARPPPPPRKPHGSLRHPNAQQRGPPPPRSCRISRLSDVASPAPSWTTTQLGSE